MPILHMQAVVRTKEDNLFDICSRLWARLDNDAHSSQKESLIPTTIQQQSVRLSPRSRCSHCDKGINT